MPPAEVEERKKGFRRYPADTRRVIQVLLAVVFVLLLVLDRIFR